jgi:hypothetical protein
MSPTGIEVTTKYFILSFLIVIFPLMITVDGLEAKGRWGTQFFPAQPGDHSVTMFWKAYWFLPANRATMTVSVADGQVARLQYYAPWFFLLPGRLTPLPLAA